MAYFTTIEGNLKGLGRIKLGQKTAVVANCGGGKSTVLEALWLVTMGGVPDLDGRAWTASAGMLCDALGDESGHLWVKATRSDGVIFSWEATAGKGLKWKHPDDGATLAPLLAIEQALSGSDEKAYQFLLRALGGAKISRNDLAMIIGRDNLELLADEVPEADFDNGDPITALTEARNVVKDRLSAARRSASALGRAAKVAAGLPPLESEIAQAERDLNGAIDAKSKAENRPRPVDTRGLEQEIDGLRRRVRIVRADVETVTERAAALREQIAKHDGVIPAEVRQRLQATHTAFLHQSFRLRDLDAHDVKCPLCGTAIERVSLIDRIQRAVAALSQKLSGSDEVAKLNRELSQTVTDLERKQRIVADLIEQGKGKVARLNELRERNAQIEANEGDVDLATLTDRVRERREKLSRMRDAAAEWKAREGLRAELDTEERKKEHLTKVLAIIERAIELLSKREIEALADRLNERMPEGWTAAVQPSPFRLGVYENGRRLSASGAQRNALLLSIGAVMVGEHGILLPPERGYDADAIASQMAALTDVDPQVVLTSNVMPSTEVEGWTILDLRGVKREQVSTATRKKAAR